MTATSNGVRLEARAHRLFLAQGSFAERGLQPAATPDRRMLATDIDVLVSEYGSGFHLTRRHVECKSGRFPLLDRVLWLRGVRVLLRADSSYLIGSDADLGASDFARSLGVQLFTQQHLDAWERSLEIPEESWPCRSDYYTFDAARRVWNRLGSQKADQRWQTLRRTLAFVEVESWLNFRYARLNRLFRLIEEINQLYARGELDRDQELCARYTFSALLVRLSQYFLAICNDVESVLPLDVETFLRKRLIFGDQDPAHAAALTRATVDWIREGLHAKGIKMPSEIDPARLQVSPTYTTEVVSLVRRLSTQSHAARYLPLAVERMQFGLEGDDELKRFRAASLSAESLAVLVKAFVARTFRVGVALGAPVRADLIGVYGSSTQRRERSSRRAAGTSERSVESSQEPNRTERRSGRKGTASKPGEGQGATELASAGKTVQTKTESEKTRTIQPSLLPTNPRTPRDQE